MNVSKIYIHWSCFRINGGELLMPTTYSSYKDAMSLFACETRTDGFVREHAKTSTTASAAGSISTTETVSTSGIASIAGMEAASAAAEAEVEVLTRIRGSMQLGVIGTLTSDATLFHIFSIAFV